VLSIIALLTRTPHWSVEASMDHWLTSAVATQAFAMLTLCVHIFNCPEVAGSVSVKMTYLYAVAYAARCYSVFFYSGYTPEDSLGTYYIYHAVELVGFIASVFAVYSMHAVGEWHQDKENDKAPITPLVSICAIAAYITRSNANDSFIPDFLWMFAQWLETAAIVPQLFLASKKGGLDKASSHFVALLILNRLILSCFWSYIQYLDIMNDRELGNYFMTGIWMSNLIHLILCADFMYYYVKSIKRGTFNIPV